jgi:hypothetical protein
VFNADGLTEIKHSTITNNSTSLYNLGAGVASQGTAATRTRVTSSIIAGNVGAAAGTHTDVDFVDGTFFNSFQSLGYNLIGTGNALGAFNAAGGDILNNLDPGLAPLADNGGSNAFVNPETHALLVGSPAKNAGNPFFTAGSLNPPLLYDQRGAGFNRVLLGRIDIGAFESNVFPVVASIESASTPAASASLVGESDGSAVAPELATATILVATPPRAGLTSLGGLPSLVSQARHFDAAARVDGGGRDRREPQAALVRQRHAAFDGWSPTAEFDDLSLAGAGSADGSRQADSNDASLCVEDDVFALLGSELRG